MIVGAVVLGYDKAAIDRATAAMGFALFVDWIRAVVLMTALTVLGIWWLTRGLESELTQAEGALAHALADAPLPIFVFRCSVRRLREAFLNSSCGAAPPRQRWVENTPKPAQ